MNFLYPGPKREANFDESQPCDKGSGRPMIYRMCAKEGHQTKQIRRNLQRSMFRCVTRTHAPLITSWSAVYIATINALVLNAR